MNQKEEEKNKYEHMWGKDEYRKCSPAFHRFFDDVKSVINEGDSIIEFGCGSGVGLGELAKSHEVIGIDIAKNCLNKDVKVPFVEACLWEPMNVKADVGFCVDVMEHIPPEKVYDTFKEIMECVPKCLFIICKLQDSNRTKRIHPTLHLTVEGDKFWLKEAEKHGKVTKIIRSTGRAIHFILENS